MPETFIENFSAMAWQKLTDSHPIREQRENVLEYSLIYECFGKRCRLTKEQSRLLLDLWVIDGKIQKNCRGIYYTVEQPATPVEVQK